MLVFALSSPNLSATSATSLAAYFSRIFSKIATTTEPLVLDLPIAACLAEGVDGVLGLGVEVVLGLRPFLTGVLGLKSSEIYPLSASCEIRIPIGFMLTLDVWLLVTAVHNDLLYCIDEEW